LSSRSVSHAISSFATLLLFFFSSRRRHTRCLSDWSSDVCSSDLEQFFSSHARTRFHVWCRVQAYVVRPKTTDFAIVPPQRGQREIGRASCRERVGTSGAAVAVINKAVT